jgi:hypothetical protein
MARLGIGNATVPLERRHPAFHDMNARCVVAAGRNQLAADEPAIMADRARVVPHVSIQAAKRQRTACDSRLRSGDLLCIRSPAAAVVLAERGCRKDSGETEQKERHSHEYPLSRHTASGRSKERRRRTEVKERFLYFAHFRSWPGASVTVIHPARQLSGDKLRAAQLLRRPSDPARLDAMMATGKDWYWSGGDGTKLVAAKRG